MVEMTPVMAFSMPKIHPNLLQTRKMLKLHKALLAKLSANHFDTGRRHKVELGIANFDVLALIAKAIFSGRSVRFLNYDAGDLVRRGDFQQNLADPLLHIFRHASQNHVTRSNRSHIRSWR